MQSTEQTCTFLVTADTRPASATEIKAALESGDPDAVRAALQAAIGALLAGEPLPGLFITLVRYVLPSEDHAVQKLLLLYLVRREWRGERKRKGGERGTPRGERQCAGVFFFFLLRSMARSPFFCAGARARPGFSHAPSPLSLLSLRPPPGNDQEDG